MNKKHIFILFTFFQLAVASSISAQNHYFRLVEKNKDIINTTITQAVSIDKVIGDTVYAYANELEFAKIKLLGIKIDELAMPSTNAKSIDMATTISQMASWNRYPTYQVYREMMKKFERDYPSLCKLDSIGSSVMGRKIYVIKISDNVTANEAEHEFYYTSTMHGDEATGFVLMLRLIDYLLANYNTSERVRNLVNNFQLFINPNSNPDGSYYYGDHTVSGSRRYNANNYDLNRNFPDPRVGSNPDGPHQIENIVQMDFATNHNFVLSANFHGGIELANYPWDAWTSTTNKHPDHNWYYGVSRKYADLAQANSPYGYFTGLGTGVTHGGDWYVVAGGRQDYMNYWHRCREITLEISSTKLPASSLLPNFWNYNLEAMLNYIENLYTGIQGTVTNANGEPLAALITIDGHDKYNSEVKTNSLHGNYIRMIEPGIYNITYSASGYQSVTLSGVSILTSQMVIKNVVLGGNSLSKSIELKIVNATNGNSVANASITILSSNGTETFTSNQDGVITLTNFPVGLAKISVEATNYLCGVFIENIASNSTQLELKILKNKFDATFTIVDESGQGIAGAVVTLNGSEATSNAEGKVVITGIPSGKYTYRISKDGFIIAEKEIDISDDLSIDVTLIPLNDNVVLETANGVQLWPNPFAHSLNISINLKSESDVHIEVFTITGQKVATITKSKYYIGRHNFQWNSIKFVGSRIGEVVYLIKVSVNGEVSMHKAIFSPSSL